MARQDGLLWRELGEDVLVLRRGRTVRVDLEEFSGSARVVPIDTGSWFEIANWPPELDLNVPGTCWSEDPNAGCRIREINQGVGLFVNGRTEFTTRDRGSSTCTSG